MRELYSIVLTVAFLAVGSVLSSHATEQRNQPSFDCAKASGKIETTICADQSLALLDRNLSEAYRAGLLTGATTATDQVAWLKRRNAECNTQDLDKCLRDLMIARISELQAATPSGATARDIDEHDCRFVQAKIRKAAPSSLPNDRFRTIIRYLSERSDSGVLISEKNDALVRHKDEVIEEIQKSFSTNQDLIDRLRKMSGTGWWLRRAGQSNLRAMESVAGTDHCSNWTFFEIANDNSARFVGGSKLSNSNLCGEYAWLGSIDGKPSMIVEFNKDTYGRVRISSRVNGAWTQTCLLTLEYAAELKVSESFCNGENCQTFAIIALEIAQQRDRNPKADPTAPGTPDSATTTPEFMQLRKIAETEGKSVMLPTFGARANSSYTGFGYDTVLVPINVGGRLYLSRLSHATFGYRESADYLVGIYDTDGVALKPVAGFIVSKTSTGVASMKIEMEP